MARSAGSRKRRVVLNRLIHPAPIPGRGAFVCCGSAKGSTKVKISAAGRIGQKWGTRVAKVHKILHRVSNLLQPISVVEAVVSPELSAMPRRLRGHQISTLVP